MPVSSSTHKFLWREVRIFDSLQEILSSYVSIKGTREGENGKYQEIRSGQIPYLQMSLRDQEKNTALGNVHVAA